MNEETVQIAQYLQQTMQRVLPMLDHESEGRHLHPFNEKGWFSVNRNNTELLSLLMQIRRDSIKLEKLMKDK